MNTITINTTLPPHQNVKVLLKGNTESPRKSLLLFHGRGSNADNIIRISERIHISDDMIVLAPDAEGHEWYPSRFIEEREQNEPNLSSALSTVSILLQHCKESYGIDPEAIVLAGFSQGACLVADYVARNPCRYGGVCVFSGGLIGSTEEIEKEQWAGDVSQTPVYIGCDKNDAHIPLDRVLKTAEIYRLLNAEVDIRIYDELRHAIHPEGFEYLNALISKSG